MVRTHGAHNFERRDSRVRAISQKGEHHNSAEEGEKMRGGSSRRPRGVELGGNIHFLAIGCDA
jgi:hypothetical protein